MEDTKLLSTRNFLNGPSGKRTNNDSDLYYLNEFPIGHFSGPPTPLINRQPHQSPMQCLSAANALSLDDLSSNKVIALQQQQ